MESESCCVRIQNFNSGSSRETLVSSPRKEGEEEGELEGKSSSSPFSFPLLSHHSSVIRGCFAASFEVSFTQGRRDNGSYLFLERHITQR